MHIRHDWQTFVKWPQKKVSTLCKGGSSTPSENGGVPGIDNPDRWCGVCCLNLIRHVERLHEEKTLDNSPEWLRNAYSTAWLSVQDSYARFIEERDAFRRRQEAKWRERNA